MEETQNDAPALPTMAEIEAALAAVEALCLRVPGTEDRQMAVAGLYQARACMKRALEQP